MHPSFNLLRQFKTLSLLAVRGFPRACERPIYRGGSMHSWTQLDCIQMQFWSTVYFASHKFESTLCQPYPCLLPASLTMAGDSVDLLFGPMLIGVFFNTILYGAFVVQTFIYFQSYKKDAPWIKCFVWYLLFCETLNTGFDIGMMYEPLVVRYATPRATTIVPIMLSADPLMTVMISSAVQLFIAWRVKVMSKSNFVPLVISFFAVTSFIGGIATTVSVTIINEYARLHQFDGAVITWLASSAAADVIITISLVWSLYHKKTGFPATDDLINRLIRLTIQTGLITAVAATLDVTIFLAVKGTTLNYVWDFALSKLYSNSLLSTLNARGGWKSSSTVRENALFGTTAVESSVSGPNTTLSQNSYVKKPNVLFPKRNSTPADQTGEYDIELRPHGRGYGTSGSDLAGEGDTGRILVSKVVEHFAESEVYVP